MSDLVPLTGSAKARRKGRKPLDAAAAATVAAVDELSDGSDEAAADGSYADAEAGAAGVAAGGGDNSASSGSGSDSNDDGTGGGGGGGGRVANARAAFASGDADASRAAHSAPGAATEHHRKGGDYVKSFIFGGLDGIITTFSVVSAVVGGNLNYLVVLVMGFANLLGDGISMGVGDYVSSTAELEFAKAERAREMWECENFIEGERAEMVDIYASKKGITRDDAETIVEIISRDYDTFVDIMMVEELHLMPPDEDDSPAKGGAVTFVAFLVCGAVPLLPYVVHLMATPADAGKKAAADATFGAAVALVAFALFALGAATAPFSTRRWYVAGAFTFGNGTLAAVASYLIAWGVSAAFGVSV